MTLIRTSLGLLVLACAGAALAGCSLGTGDSGTAAVDGAQPILGGALAEDPKYAAVGALAIEYDLGPDEPPAYYPICSATLVGSKAVVTAKHCTEALAAEMASGFPPRFVLGPDAWVPEQVVPITGWVEAPASEDHPGLMLRGGRDLAVAYLSAAPEGVEPAKVGHFNQAMVGRQFEIAGYGESDLYLAEWGFTIPGYRFVGLATARALEGRWYELLFDGDKQAYLDWYFLDAVTASPTAGEAEAWWDLYQLEPGYELLAGGLEGEAVGCYGDSGGPLLSITKNKLTVYGVSFAVEASIANVCDHGSAYLIFNAKMRDFVRDAVGDAVVE